MALDIDQAIQRRDTTRAAFANVVERSNIHSMLVEGAGKPRATTFNMRISEEDANAAKAIAADLDMSVACLFRMLLHEAQKSWTTP